MSILIIINAEVDSTGKIISTSPATENMVSALKQAIQTYSTASLQVEVQAAAALWSDSVTQEPQIYCPITIQLPETFQFPAQPIYQACKAIESRRSWVAEHLHYRTGRDQGWLGDRWLPVVLTAKGPLYGEVIEEGVIPNSFKQPVDLTDEIRQPLYHLAYELLRSISATPAVYLVQFSLQDKDIVFDRLWPFPAAPAIASLGVQSPDLFTCHWHCLTGQPILDLTIMPKH